MSRLCLVAALFGLIGWAVGCQRCEYCVEHNVAAEPSRARPVDLSSQQWDHRMLLIFAPSANDPKLRTQRIYLTGHEDVISDAQVKPIEVIGDGRVHLGSGWADPEARRLRERFGVFDELFTVILVGKDGQSRARSTDPLTARQITRAVDAPPLDTPGGRTYGIAPRPTDVR